MEFILDFILHIDQYMIDIVQEYHTWTYVILFIIIFCETGLVVTPFLPGDSLLFVAGAIASLPGTLGASCLITPIPEYSSKVIWIRHMNFIKNMVARL